MSHRSLAFVLTFAAAPPAVGHETVTDTDLLRAVAQQADGAAFERLYHEHRAAVHAAAAAIVRDPDIAADVTQRTFVALWERAPRLMRRDLRLRSWLLTVARNAAIDHLRATTPAMPLDAATLVADTASDPADAAVTSVLSDRLAGAIACLSREQRTVIERRYFSGQTFAAIAAATGEPLSTIKSREHLAIEHLRAAVS